MIIKKQLKRLKEMTDEKGIVQHSDLNIPNPDYDYSIDDQSRALIVLSRYSKQKQKPKLAETYLNYLAEAKRKDGFFYNYKDKNNKWLDIRQGVIQSPENLQDCAGRTIWALAEFLNSSYPEKQRKKAKQIFFESLKLIPYLEFPHSQAFTTIGLSKYLQENNNREIIKDLEYLTEKLKNSFNHYSDKNWSWFSEKMTYCNARIPHSMLLAGEIIQNKEYISIGKSSLNTLINASFNEGNFFNAIRNHTWLTKEMYLKNQRSEGDEQPIEPACFVELSVDASKILKNKNYLNLAKKTLEYFYGRNSINKKLLAQNYGVYDGITKDKTLNKNQGAESIVSYIMAFQSFHKII
jgi:hypothetical protein